MKSEKEKNVKRTKKLALLGMCCAAAMILSYVESFIPFGVPGLKVGLPNIVTVFLLYKIGWKETAVVSLLRCVLTALLFGTVMSLAYSIAGAILSLAVMALLTLASCGFNYSGESMSKYAEFNNSVFKDKIASLTIEDGEFSQADATKRENMVMDAIWAAIAGKADTTDKLVGKVDDPETDEDEAEAE